MYFILPLIRAIHNQFMQVVGMLTTLSGMICFGLYGQQQDSLALKLMALDGLKKAEAYNEAVFHYIRIDPIKTLDLVEQSENFAKIEGGQLIEAYAAFNRGIYYSGRGMIDSAIVLMEKANQIAGKENIPFFIKCGVGLGRNYIAAGQPEKALDILLRCMRMMETHPDEGSEVKAKVNITWAYLELKRYRDCITFGMASLASIKPAFERFVPYLCNNMSAAYGALSKLDSAAFIVSKGISIAEKYGELGILANSYFILGNIYSQTGQYDLAIRHFQKARPLREQTGDIFYQVADLYVISDLYHKLGNYKMGVEAGIEGLEIAKKNNIVLKFEGVYQSLAKNYEGLADYRNAAHYYQLLAAAKDSIYQNATAEAIVEMQARYEAEKKEMRLAEQNLKLEQNRLLIIFLITVLVLIVVIALFWQRQIGLKQKQELAMKEKKLQTQLTEAVINLQEAERARFAKDLHDGMGQLLSSIRLYIGKTNHEWTNTVLGLLDQAHREIREIAFALLPNTLTREGLVQALVELAHRIDSSKIVTADVDATGLDERLPDKIELSLYRICQEWMNNILKYGNASRINIHLINHTGHLSMVIEDNGDGFDPMRLEETSGNGWKNIQSRVSQHNGIVFLDSTPAIKGNSLVVEIPMTAHSLQNVA